LLDTVSCDWNLVANTRYAALTLLRIRFTIEDDPVAL
jgi:hypothetical protein